jgi:glycosyltransferase involved in cell wall biosynthesis
VESSGTGPADAYRPSGVDLLILEFSKRYASHSGETADIFCIVPGRTSAATIRPTLRPVRKQRPDDQPAGHHGRHEGRRITRARDRVDGETPPVRCRDPVSVANGRLPSTHVKGRSVGRAQYDVAFYVPWIGPLLTSRATSPTGGAETQIFLLARALARRGAKVCLLTFDLPGTTIPSSVDEIAVSVRPPYRAHQPLGKVRETIELCRAVARADAKVLVTRGAGPEVGFVGILTRLLRRKFVYSSANVADFDYGRLEAKRLNRALFRVGTRLADEIVVQTVEQVRLCRERFGGSPLLIRSIAEPAPQRDRRPEAFLWVGRLVSYKRPFAFVELARSLPEAKFWMVGVPIAYADGGPELVVALERKAATVPNLELLPPRSRPEVLKLVDRAVAIVNTADFEGMPNIFLEGWSRGVPTLALTHDPDGVIERHHLGAFAHGSSERLVDLARRVWDEREDQADIAARCRQYIFEHHSPEAVSARWQEALGIASSERAARAALAP